MRDRTQRLLSEVSGYDLRLEMTQRVLNFLPPGGFGVLRAAIYRRAGLSIGRHTVINGSIFFGATRLVRSHLRIGGGSYINSHVFIDTAAPVSIGSRVSIGHHVVVITSDHAIGTPEFRAGPLEGKPVTIEDGAWVAAGVTILPGVTIGRGAVVAAGAVVTKDVLPNTLVRGIPAKAFRPLSE